MRALLVLIIVVNATLASWSHNLLGKEASTIDRETPVISISLEKRMIIYKLGEVTMLIFRYCFCVGWL